MNKEKDPENQLENKSDKETTNPEKTITWGRRTKRNRENKRR